MSFSEIMVDGMSLVAKCGSSCCFTCCG